MDIFRKKKYQLDACHLLAADRCNLQDVAIEFANMDPWKRLRFSSKSLAKYFTGSDENLFKFGVLLNRKVVGVITIRHPWMRGPYLEFMGLLPASQNTGIGKQLLTWMEQQAKSTSQRNIWTAVSQFNTPAYNFYTGFGFKEVADLEDLVIDNYTEILLRKKIR